MCSWTSASALHAVRWSTSSSWSYQDGLWSTHQSLCFRTSGIFLKSTTETYFSQERYRKHKRIWPSIRNSNVSEASCERTLMLFTLSLNKIKRIIVSLCFLISYSYWHVCLCWLFRSNKIFHCLTCCYHTFHLCVLDYATFTTKFYYYLRAHTSFCLALTQRRFRNQLGECLFSVVSLWGCREVCRKGLRSRPQKPGRLPTHWQTLGQAIKHH